MVRKPLPSVIAVAVLFILLGCLDLYLGVAPMFQGAGSVHIAGDDLLVTGLGVAAGIGGVFLFLGYNWARWLLAGWMALHVALSFPAPFRLLAHVLIFAFLIFLLFRRGAAGHFRRPATG
jgi:hypothetical protein